MSWYWKSWKKQEQQPQQRQHKVTDTVSQMLNDECLFLCRTKWWWYRDELVVEWIVSEAKSISKWFLFRRTNEINHVQKAYPRTRFHCRYWGFVVAIYTLWQWIGLGLGFYNEFYLYKLNVKLGWSSRERLLGWSSSQIVGFFTTVMSIYLQYAYMRPMHFRCFGKQFLFFSKPKTMFNISNLKLIQAKSIRKFEKSNEHDARSKKANF